MRTALLLIGLIVSSVSFAGEKQLTCLFIEDDITGLLDTGAWKSNKIIFNTDDFGELDPLLTVIAEHFNKHRNNISLDSLTPKSSANVWWICKCGNEFQQTVKTRTSNGDFMTCSKCE